MPHYTIDESPTTKGLQFVTRIHRMRVLGTLLCALPVASVLWDRSAAAAYWVFVLLNALVWPQIALIAGRRAKDPIKCEFRSMVMDSAFGGAWIAAMALSAAPTAAFLSLLTADKIAAGGWRLASKSTLALAGTFVIVWALLGFPFQPRPSARTLLACLPFMFIYTATLSLLTHRLSGRIRRQNRELRRLTRIDPVMQVPNRPHFEAVAARELSRFHRSGRPASMLLIDVDRFKVINDRYGHVMGDVVLKRVATILRETVRDVDVPARYGGDEFAILLVDTDGPRAMEIAERLRQQVEQEVFADAPGLTCTLSIGVAEAVRDYATLDSWVRATDAALYRAKAAGRNCIDLVREEPWSDRRLLDAERPSRARA